MRKNTQLNRRSFLKRTAAAGASTLATQAAHSFDLAAATSSNPTIIRHALPQVNDVTNPIVAENALPGSPDWPITKRQNDIEGFASETSVAAGDELVFSINTRAPMFDLLIYRAGYYGGVGARLIEEVRGLKGTQQPAPKPDSLTGLHSCSHWSPSHQLTVPNDWVSGVYLAKLIRPDTGGEACIYFVVRRATHATAHKSDILFQQSISTYQAYNPHGGKSLYHFNSGVCQTVSGGPRAVKVSFDRPYAHELYGPNQYFLSDYPFVYWLEAQGYDVSYCTSLDTHASGKQGTSGTSGASGAANFLLGHKVFLSVGHDEYWSQEMRDAIVAARDAGVHLGFFSSNTGYWRVRFEPDPATGKPDRVMCCYKTTESGVPDPIIHTGTWRDPATVNQPENGLLGVQYIGDNDLHFFPIRVSAEQAQDRIYRNTHLPQLQPGQTANIGRRLVGWEWDAVVDNGHTPIGLQVLAGSPVFGNVLDDFGRTYSIGKATHQATRYVAASGAQVFAAGTNHWAWGLGVFDVDAQLQQITCNLLADMGALPTTPDESLTVDAPAVSTTQQRHRYQDGTQAEFDFLRVTPHSKYGETLTHYSEVLPDSTEPIIRNVRITTEGRTVTVRWESDVPTSGQVWMRITPKQADYRLSAEQGWSLPLAGMGVSEPYSTQHEVLVPWLDMGRTYYATLASADPKQRVAILSEQRIETAKGSIFNSALITLRTRYRSLPCWLRDNGLVSAIVSGAALAAVAGAITWRTRRLARNVRKRPQ